MNHARLYRNELTHLCYGNPVWEPNPGTLYDCVRIGDVGYFQNDQFMPLFNILPPDDSNQTRRLPFPQPDFPALCLPANYPNTQDRNPLEAGVYALESSLTFSASVGVDSAGSVLHGESSLSFTSEKGAALILPSEACREDTLYDKLFKQHMLKYYRQWYTFALTECQRDIKLCDLILVTGCDLTRQWATATYFRSHREMSAALGAQVAPVAEAKFSLSAGWRTNQAMNTRRGPPQAFRQQPRQDNDETQNDNGTLVNNQCIFLRGFYVKDRLWGPQVMKAGAGYHDPGKRSPEEEGAEGVLTDDDVAVESLLPLTQGKSFMSVLLDYMLEVVVEASPSFGSSAKLYQESDANVVIVNDSDLWPYLGEVENPENLRDTLKRMSPHISVEDGVGSLIIQDLEASESAEKENERREALETHATAEFPGIDVDEATAPPRKGFSFFQGLSFSTIMGGSFVASSGRTFTNSGSSISTPRNDQRPSVQKAGVSDNVPMTCINCRQKKLKCHTPDKKQRECPHCIEAGVPCEYDPVNPSPTTANTPHHDSPLIRQPLHRGPQSLSRPGYYATQPNNMQEEQCEYLEWKGFVSGTDTQQRVRPMHICSTTPDIIVCSHSQHIPGDKCWRGTIDSFFNGSVERRKIKKPPVNESFLCVDTQFIKAFVLLAINHVNIPLEIEATRHNESGEVLVHISLLPNQLNHFFQRNLTILEVDRLLCGYPPFYREVLNCNGIRVPSPIRTDYDVSRGGWVIGAGLSSTNPIPVYVDKFYQDTTIRGEVFWRALTHVKALLENNIRLLYLDNALISKRINAVINGLTHIIDEKTDSGLDRALQDSGLMSYTPRILTQEECIRAMKIFNGSCKLDNDGLANLKTQLQGMILEVLKAALLGAKACITYVKDPGRELDLNIPAILANSERVFLRGCRADPISSRGTIGARLIDLVATMH